MAMAGVTEGRVVHYVPSEEKGLGVDPSNHLPATICQVRERGDEPVVNLVVLAPNEHVAELWGGSTRNIDHVKFSEGKEPGSCHFVERA